MEVLDPQQQEELITTKKHNEALQDANLKSKQDLETELRQEKDFATKLIADIKEQEEVVINANNAAVSLWARNVSGDLPDDTIRRELQLFFDGDFQDWCRDNSVEQINDQQKLAGRLARRSIMSGVQNPSHLRIDMSNAVAPAVLLQAALPASLCQDFLANSLITLGQLLREGLGHSLRDIEAEFRFSGVERDEVTAWKRHTLQLLGKALALRHKDFLPWAEGFISLLHGLIQDPKAHHIAVDLAQLAEQFARLILKIETLDMTIESMGLSHFENISFQSSSYEMTADTAVNLQPGDRKLDGRPIIVVTRPLITSLLNAGGSKPAEPVVLLKASVWVSNSE